MANSATNRALNGRLPSKTVRGAAIKFVKPHHDEIARMLVIGGMKQKDIAKRLDMNQGWLSLLIRQPMVQIKIKKLQEARDRDALDVGKEMDAAALPAFAKLERTMYNSTSERMGIHCAESILDRAGYGRVTKSINTNTNINATMTRDEMVQLLAKRLGMIKAESEQHLKDVADAQLIELETTGSYEEPGVDEMPSTVEHEEQIIYGSPD